MKIDKLGWLVRAVLMFTVLAGASVGSSGCIWLALPSLAYEGYKYDHQSNTGSTTDADVTTHPDPSSQDNAASDRSSE